MNRFIDNILDIPKVQGLCVFGPTGEVLLNRMPDFVLPEIFHDLSRRVVSLYETIDENFMPCQDYLLKFPDHWIQMRRSNSMIFFILAEESVNIVSLKMVTNMALKHASFEELSALKKDVPSVNGSHKVSSEQSRESEESSPASANDSPKRVSRSQKPQRTYRGNAY